jgi:SAM-dependent methyltransferase
VERRELGASGFSDGAQYNAARPSYPNDALNHFVENLHLTAETRAIDIGAGSGIFTRQIAPYVGSLLAIEPSASMRSSFEKLTPGVTILDGNDVALPVATSSVDVAFVAQAFHWFDVERSLAEMHRVLVPGGRLGMIWNERDESVDWVRALSHAMQWDVKQPYIVGTDFSDAIASGPFTNVDRVQFANPQELTHDGLYQRVLSTSYIAVMPENERSSLMNDVRQLVETLPNPVVLPHVTDVYTALAM